MDAQALLAERSKDRPQLGGTHVPNHGRKGLHVQLLGPGAPADRPVEHLLRPGPELRPGPTETDIAYPQLGAPDAGVAVEGGLEGGLCRVGVAEAQLVPDGEYPAAEAVVRAGEDGLVEDGTDGIVDAEAGFRPGEEGKEYGVPREEGNEVAELVANESRPERAGLAVVSKAKKKKKGGEGGSVGE